MLAKIARYVTKDGKQTKAETLEEQLELMVQLYSQTLSMSGGLVPICNPFPITPECNSVTVTFGEWKAPAPGLYVICLKTR